MLEIITSSATIVNPTITSQIHDVILTALQMCGLALSGGLAWLIKLGISKLKDNWQMTLAARFVSFAESKIIPGPEKRALVASKLHEKFPRLTEDEISHLIEEAVMNLSASLEPTTVTVTPQITIAPTIPPAA